MPSGAEPQPQLLPWRAPFLRALARWPDVKAACDGVGIAQTTAYRHNKKDRIFADAWRRALADGRARLNRESAAAGRSGAVEKQAVLSLARDGRPRMALAGNNRMTQERETRFFEILMETASISAAARGIGMSLTAIYNRRQRDAEFDAAILETVAIAADALSFALIRAGSNSVAPTIADVDTPLVSVSQAIRIVQMNLPELSCPR